MFIGVAINRKAKTWTVYTADGSLRRASTTYKDEVMAMIEALVWCRNHQPEALVNFTYVEDRKPAITATVS